MGKNVRRVTLIVLDSVGCGDAPDVAAYGDEGSNTLGNIARVVGGLNLPNLKELGLGNLTTIDGVPATERTRGAYGRLTEVSAGKDTTTGHWELAGILVEHPFPVFPNGFPDELVRRFEKAIGRKTLGNIPASGTEIIASLGDEHVRTGSPILYTSADSVFQIAAHEDVIPLEELYAMCRTARDMLTGEYAVGRVIARPFIGKSGAYVRTENRRDFSLEPLQPTLLDVLKAAGMEVAGVGKIEDIFAHRGITRSDHTGNNMAGVDAVLNFLKDDFEGLIFANLVDFDALFGHRNNPQGYADALEEFDRRLPEIMQAMKEYDALIITADHGNDPTTPSTDHSRERTPVLIVGHHIRSSTNIGTRAMFADVAATIADLLDVRWTGAGESFAAAILKD